MKKEDIYIYILYKQRIIHQHCQNKCICAPTAFFFTCGTELHTYALIITTTLPGPAHTPQQARVGFSAHVLSVLVICKHQRGIILHNEALQRLPALTSRSKFGSGRNKSLPPPSFRPPFQTHNHTSPL